MQKESIYGNSIFVIRDFLTAEECERFITDGVGRGFEEAPLNATFGTQMRKDVRDNTRVIFDDSQLAVSLYQRAAPFLAPRSGKWGIVGFDESVFTFMIYLNDGYEGGSTDFFDREDQIRARVILQRGTALVFEHQQVHEGSTVISGRKYVLRTDVMYSYKPL